MVPKTFKARFRKGHIEPEEPVVHPEGTPLRVTAEEAPAERETRGRTDIWAGYDPARAREALKESAGALKHVDREVLLRDLYEQREQDSRGRPA